MPAALLPATSVLLDAQPRCQTNLVTTEGDRRVQGRSLHVMSRKSGPNDFNASRIEQLETLGQQKGRKVAKDFWEFQERESQKMEGE